jgi:hypothetical protein
MKGLRIESLKFSTVAALMSIDKLKSQLMGLVFEHGALARLLGNMKRRRSWCSSSANYRYADQLNDGVNLRTGPTVCL